ncbi:MAG: tetraacyldisaccharide 4'-kinase [Flavobacteriales bacterium Tduv]
MKIAHPKRTLIKTRILRCLIGRLLSWGYDIITSIRNHFYDKDWVASISFPIPIICVGNLNLGGSGKTPHIEYLIRLLKGKYKIAVLSRGYKRKSSGFVWADEKSTAMDIGDEPLQYFKKFGKDIYVAVGENRAHSIKELIRLEAPDIILLDDGFQHRRVRVGYNILLTDHDNLYCDDALIPLGTLRENAKNAERAHLIIVTKCPENTSEKHQEEIIKKLRPEKNQQVFFSSIKYRTHLHSKKKLPIEKLEKMQVLLVTGITHAQPLLDFLKKKASHVTHLNYPDHHNFTIKNYSDIYKSFTEIPVNKIIITTEKDYMRMNLSQLKDLPVFYLPISIQLNKKKYFNEKILKYVSTTQTNYLPPPR